jgi:hypothetical protein
MKLLLSDDEACDAVIEYLVKHKRFDLETVEGNIKIRFQPNDDDGKLDRIEIFYDKKAHNGS